MQDEKSYKKLRIFLASPSDVSKERDRVHAVANELNRTGNVADQLGLTLEVLDWRTHVAPYMGRPEDVVLQQLPVDSWDVFIGILWLRFGMPTGAIDPGTGQAFDSGTEEEFTLAYHAWKKYNRPQILFYRCTRSPKLDQIDPDQYKKVKAFFADFDADKRHPGRYQAFQETEDFKQLARQDLTKLLFDYRKLNCHLCNGTRIKSLSNYFVLHQNRPLIIENVPAEVCRQCGERHFDPATVAMLQKVVWSKKKPKQTMKMPVYSFSTLIRKYTKR